MDTAQAWRDLGSEDTERRLAAARFLSRRASAGDLSRLRAAQAKEASPWVQRALAAGIEKFEMHGPRQPPDQSSPREDSADASASLLTRAKEEATEELLHELSPLIGALGMYAEVEVKAWPKSQTKKIIEQLSGLAEAFRDLRRVSALPRLDEVSLGELVETIISTIDFGSNTTINLIGPTPFQVFGDRGQLSIGIRNGLRNAAEAVRQVEAGRITVNWGRTRDENWLCIKDNGPGLQIRPAEAVRKGGSAKAGHLGYGLALAKQALSAMAGDISIRNDLEGVHFEMRWYRDDADPAR